MYDSIISIVGFVIAHTHISMESFILRLRHGTEKPKEIQHSHTLTSTFASNKPAYEINSLSKILENLWVLAKGKLLLLFL